jgi:hypothetical protein
MDQQNGARYTALSHQNDNLVTELLLIDSPKDHPTTQKERSHYSLNHRLSKDEADLTKSENEEVQNPESKLEPNSPKVSFGEKLSDYWILELASIVGSFLVMIAIILVLWVYDHKPIPEWPYGITINSVLSWLSQIMNTTMLGVVANCLGQAKWLSFSKKDRALADMSAYDSASRGVIGCIMFGWTTDIRSVYKASWSSFISTFMVIFIYHHPISAGMTDFSCVQTNCFHRGTHHRSCDRNCAFHTTDGSSRKRFRYISRTINDN